MAGSNFDSRELRNAFGCFATGVTVVTTLDSSGKAIGKTANSFASVSLDPPLVLWCLDKRSATFKAFHQSQNFVISVLSTNAESISRRFGSRGGHIVEAETPTVMTKLGPPACAGALAIFECETEARHDGGDHVILVGRVVRFSYDASGKEAKPLVFYRGSHNGIKAFED